jgi:cell shape-determining protein MreC
MHNFGDISRNALVDLLLSLNEFELATLGFIIPILIAPTITANQQNALGNFFELIGQTLQTTSTQATNLKKDNQNQNNINDKIQKLEEELSNLKRQLNL